ncbi:MAG: CoA transferase [Acetobacteraceae bacterium]
MIRRSPRKRSGATSASGVNAAIQEKLLTDTTASWVSRLNKAGVPCGPVNTMDKVFADEQVQHLALEMPVEHPTLGTLALVRPPMQIEGVEPGKRPTPERGQHTHEVLREFGFTDAQIETLSAEGAI